MIRVLAAAVRNIKTAVAENKKVVNKVVELDQLKQELGAYESPLKEVRDSL